LKITFQNSDPFTSLINNNQLVKPANLPEDNLCIVKENKMDLPIKVFAFMGVFVLYPPHSHFLRIVV